MDRDTDSDDTIDGRINRRKFIQSLSVANGVVGGSLFASGVGAADGRFSASVNGTTAKKAVKLYDNIDVVKEEIRQQSAGFLQKLSEEDYLVDDGIDTFDFSEIKAPWEAMQSGKGVATTAIPVGDGKFTSELTLHKSTDKGQIVVTVIPELNRNFAILNPQNDEDYTPLEETDEGISPADFCRDKTVCFNPYRICSGMSPSHMYRVTHCRNGNCYHSFITCCAIKNCITKFICQC